MSELVDWRFVVGWEGNWSKGYVPNVKDNQGRIRSGTTIISGLDLGHHDERYIRGLGLSPALTEKLLPFVGKTGSTAVMAAENRFEQSLELLNRLNRVTPANVGGMRPTGVIGNSSGPLRAASPREVPTQFIASGTDLALELTEDERKELTKAVRGSYYRNIASHYDRETRGAHFATLPSELQTALLSLHWHSGSIWSLHHLARDIFACAARHDWRGALDGLRGGEFYSAPTYFKFRARRRSEAELIRRGAKIPADFVGPKERRYMERIYTIGSVRARTA